MVAPNALVAAAQVLVGTRSQDPARQHRAWQDEAWQFYDETGPLRYATNWLANLNSRARLQAAVLTPTGDEPEPIDSGPAADAVESLAGGVNGQSQMLRSCTVDLTVPGIGYLVGRGTEAQAWRMYSADVLRMRSPATISQPAIYELQEEDGKWVQLEPDSLVVRIWRPHERYYWESDSPARAALGDLRELRRIRQYIDATLVSRLSGAGILTIPQEVSYPTAPNEPDSGNSTHPFITEVVEVMMTAVREPGTAAQIVPIPIEMPYEYVDGFKHLTFHTELSDKILDMRESALRQCAITLDVPAEVLTGMGDLNHWGCLDDNTEILTLNGWRTHEQVSEGDTVLTLNHDTGLSEWQPVLRMNRYEVDTDLTRMVSQGHDSLSTDNHRWATIARKTGKRRWRRTDTLNQADNIPTAVPCADLPTVAKWSDDLVELVAWMWTEGHMGRSNMLAQSHVVHPANTARIAALLERTYGPSVESLHGIGRPAWRQQLRGGLVDKLGVTHRPVTLFYLNKAAVSLFDFAFDAPKLVSLQFIRELTQAQLELFIAVSRLGDGRHKRYEDFTQRHSNQLDALEYAAILAGRMVRRRTEMLGSGGEDGGPVEHHALTLYQRSVTSPIRAAVNLCGAAQVYQEHYKGTVWCPTTPNGSWLARRNGTVYYTGNSWQIEESAVKIHAEPLLELITSALTVGFLHPVLEAQGMDKDEAAQFVIWADTSELSTKPDKSDDTVSLYDRGEASGVALRRETGLSEADKPTDEELADWAYKKAITAGGETITLGMEGLGIAVPEPPAPVVPVSSNGAQPGVEEPADDDEQGPPSTQDDERGEFNLRVLVLESYVHRALERAGNRIRSKRRAELQGCDDEPYICLGGVYFSDDLLLGAWDRLPTVLDELRFDAPIAIGALTSYCRTLIEHGMPYERASLVRALKAALRETEDA